MKKEKSKITLITGPNGSGKTSAAKSMTAGCKTVTISEVTSRNPFWAAFLTDDTEYIIIDDVTNTENIIGFMDDRLCINRLMEKPHYIDMPKIIIISNCIAPAQLEQYGVSVKHINLKKRNTDVVARSE